MPGNLGAGRNTGDISRQYRLTVSSAPASVLHEGLVPTLGQRLLVLLLSDVQIVHVGCMMLAVVQLHDLGVNVRL